MHSYFGLIAYHLRSLARFSGRDARPTFWPWAITLLLAAMAAMSAIMVPVMTGMTGLARQHPGQSRIEAGAGSYSVHIDGGVQGAGSIMAPAAIGAASIAAIVVLLLAASVTRRLHDLDKSGAWGLLPLPFLVTGLILFSWIFNSFEAGGPPDAVFFAGILNNFVYLAALVYLVVLLIRHGDPGLNRHGPPPVTPVD